MSCVSADDTVLGVDDDDVTEVATDSLVDGEQWQEAADDEQWDDDEDWDGNEHWVEEDEGK